MGILFFFHTVVRKMCEEQVNRYTASVGVVANFASENGG